MALSAAVLQRVVELGLLSATIFAMTQVRYRSNQSLKRDMHEMLPYHLMRKRFKCA